MSKRKRPSSLLLVDAEDRIVADVLCIKCGHNLRNLYLTQRCPNCNHPASDSVHGDYLIHSDRETVAALADAARLVQYGGAILGGLTGLAVLAALISADSLDAAVRSAYDIVFAAAVISPVVATLGLVLLTARRTAAYYWLRYGNPRVLLRFGLLMALVLAAILVAAAYLGQVAVQIGIVLWFVIPLGAFFRGVERLMRRVPNSQLATFARATLVSLMAFGILAILIILIRDRSARDPSWHDSQLAFTAINCLGGLVLATMAYLLIVRVRRTLTSIAS